MAFGDSTERYESQILATGENPTAARTFTVELPIEQALDDGLTDPMELPREGDPFPTDPSLVCTGRTASRLSPTVSVVTCTYTRPLPSWGGIDPDSVGYKEEGMEIRVGYVTTPEVFGRQVVVTGPFAGILHEWETIETDVEVPEVVYTVRVVSPVYTSVHAAVIALQTGKLHAFGGATWVFEGATVYQNRQTTLTTRTWEITYSWFTRPTISAYAGEVSVTPPGTFVARPALPVGWVWIVVNGDGTSITPPTIIARKVKEDGSPVGLPGSPI